MQEAIEIIKNDIKTNLRCLEEDLAANTINLLEMWLDYDRKLLKLLEGELKNENIEK